MDPVRAYLAARGWTPDGVEVGYPPSEPSPLVVLAQRADISYDLLLSQCLGRSRSIEFNAADRLLCCIGRVDLWRGELVDLYYGVNLNAVDQRRGNGETSTHCRKGHERTEENTRTKSNGKIECRICRNDREKRYYADGIKQRGRRATQRQELETTRAA